MRQTEPNDKPPPHETPAAAVVRVFGLARASALIGLTSEAVKKWRRPRSRGGQGGLVPARYQGRYLAEAEARGLPLTPRQLIAEPRP